MVDETYPGELENSVNELPPQEEKHIQKKKPSKKPPLQPQQPFNPPTNPIPPLKKNEFKDFAKMVIVSLSALILIMVYLLSANSSQLSQKDVQLDQASRTFNATQTLLNSISIEKATVDNQFSVCSNNLNSVTQTNLERGNSLAICNNQTQSFKDSIALLNSQKETLSNSLLDCKVNIAKLESKVDLAMVNSSNQLQVQALNNQIHILELNSSLGTLDSVKNSLNSTLTNFNLVVANYAKDYCCALYSNVTFNFYSISSNKITCTGSTASNFNVTC